MTASFADNRFAALPMSDLTGVISMHYSAKNETGVVLHERQVCSGELARINRAIEQMADLSLPLMSGSSRSASAVRDARSQSVADSRNNSRSASVQQQSAITETSSANQQNTSTMSLMEKLKDPKERKKRTLNGVHACAHQIKEAVGIVTAMPEVDENSVLKQIKSARSADSSIHGKKGLPVWNVESKVKALRENENFEITLSHRLRTPPEPGEILRPTFRKLAPSWNRHEHQKHKQYSAKVYKEAPSSYGVNDDGVVESVPETELMKKNRESAQQKIEQLSRQGTENALYSMAFGRESKGSHAEIEKKRNEARIQEHKKQVQERGNSPSRSKGEKREWKFQVPSLLSRRALEKEKGANDTQNNTVVGAAATITENNNNADEQ